MFAAVKKQRSFISLQDAILVPEGVPVPRFSKYMVTPQGEVFKVWGSVMFPGRPVKVFVNNGLPTVQLEGDDGRHVLVRLHRLVCEAFHGPAPSYAQHAYHLDGNIMNNSKGNVLWHKREHRARKGTSHHMYGKNHTREARQRMRDKKSKGTWIYDGMPYRSLSEAAQVTGETTYTIKKYGEFTPKISKGLEVE